MPLAVALGLFGTVHGAEPAVASPKEIRERIDAAAKRLDGGQRDEAVELLAEAITGLEVMATAARPPVGFKTLADRAAGVRRRLDRAGADVSRLMIPMPASPVPVPMPAAAKPVVGKATGVSFSRQVAPILASSCGGCHIAGRKGGFQMMSYEGLMKTGMVQRGAGQASRLVEVILTGDMPRGGGKVSAENVATLIRWIDSGAACDAADPSVGIDVLARGGGLSPAPASPTAVKAVPLKPGEVSFASDVAPLLQAQCLKCHGGDEIEANLSMASLDRLLRGGRTGAAIVPGKGADSLLVKKLRGADIEGQRMPLGRPPLSDADVALIEKWITEGASLDMLTAVTPLETLVAEGQARKLSDTDLARVRFAAGEKLWRRALPDEEPVVQSRVGVCVIGNLPADRLAAFADLAEDVVSEVREELIADGSQRQPLLKGGIVVYAVKQAVDYSAIWQNVSKAERPKGISSHAGVSGEVVYAALLAPSTAATADRRAALAESVTAAAFAGRNAPEWFGRGAGRASATRLAGTSDLVQQWRRETATAVPRLGSAADFFAGHSDPAASALAAGGFVGSIATPGKLSQMVALLDAGAAFDEAFTRVFRAPPLAAFEKWAARMIR